MDRGNKHAKPAGHSGQALLTWPSELNVPKFFNYFLKTLQHDSKIHAKFPMLRSNAARQGAISLKAHGA